MNQEWTAAKALALPINLYIDRIQYLYNWKQELFNYPVCFTLSAYSKNRKSMQEIKKTFEKDKIHNRWHINIEED